MFYFYLTNDALTHQARERIKVILFVVVFVVALMFRTTEIDLISILAQTLFASTLIPAYLRLEVLNHKNRVIFDCLYDIFLFHNHPIENYPQNYSIALLNMNLQRHIQCDCCLGQTEAGMSIVHEEAKRSLYLPIVIIY